MAITEHLNTREARVQAIFEATAKHFGITTTELCSSDTTDPMREYRSVAIFLAVIYTSCPLAKIGTLCGGRTQSSVDSIFERRKRLLRNSKRSLASSVAAIEQTLGLANEKAAQ